MPEAETRIDEHEVAGLWRNVVGVEKATNSRALGDLERNLILLGALGKERCQRRIKFKFDLHERHIAHRRALVRIRLRALRWACSREAKGGLKLRSLGPQRCRLHVAAPALDQPLFPLTEPEARLDETAEHAHVIGEPTHCAPTSLSPEKLSFRYLKPSSSISRAVSPPSAPCHNPKDDEINPMVSSTFMLREPRCGVGRPAMFMPAMRPCSTATG